MSNLDRYPLLPSDVGSLYLPVGRPAPGGFGTRGASILFLAPTGSASVGSRAVASGSVGVISKRGPPVAPTPGFSATSLPYPPAAGGPLIFAEIRRSPSRIRTNHGGGCDAKDHGPRARERIRADPSFRRTGGRVRSASGWNAFIDDDGNVHKGVIEAIAAEGITRGCNPQPTIGIAHPARLRGAQWQHSWRGQ